MYYQVLHLLSKTTIYYYLCPPFTIKVHNLLPFLSGSKWWTLKVHHLQNEVHHLLPNGSITLTLIIYTLFTIIWSRTSNPHTNHTTILLPNLADKDPTSPLYLI